MPYIETSAVERILEKSPGIAHVTKSDGFTALHIAAINDHKEIASILILKVLGYFSL